MMIEYFIYSALTTGLVAVGAYFIGRNDGHEEGLKKGSRAISNVNKTLDELVLSLEANKDDVEGPVKYGEWHTDTASDPLPPADVVTTTPKVEVVEKPKKAKAPEKKQTPKRGKKGRK